MSTETEFDVADREAGVAEVIVLPPKNDRVAFPQNQVDYRNQLVARYHRGAKNLVERLRTAGQDDAETLLVALINEMVQETDHLLGNELVATENGELRDASVISFKRVEALEKAAKAVQTKQALTKDAGIDIDSPAMMLVFRYFMSKVKQSLVKMNVPDDMSDLIITALSNEMKDWKRDLRAQFAELKGAK